MLSIGQLSMSIKRVLVTGATGRTGSLVVQKLRQCPNDFEAIAFARSEVKAKALFDTTDGFFFGDINQASTLNAAFSRVQILVIVTSAVPQIKTAPQPGERPEFGFELGGTPEEVDYIGQKHQIDAAIAAGVEHIILVGSMGGTNDKHPLNQLGNGNILIWKRKAEKYLIDSGIDYTIIRAGGLLDEPGGVRELLVGKDDAFLNHPPDGIPTSIPRADVAEVVVQALQNPKARNKAFDLISKLEEDSSTVITTNFEALFAQTTPGL